MGVIRKGVDAFVEGLMSAGKKEADDIVESLPMDTSSRMERAREQGYTQKAYMGVREGAEEIEALDPDVGTGARRGTGNWAAQNPVQSNTYARDASIPLRLNTSNYARVDFGGANWNDRPEYLELELPDGEVVDVSGMDTNEIARLAREYGVDGVQFEQITDLGPIVKKDDMPAIEEYYREGDTQFAIFNPSTARSPNAAFDPAKKSSANLLASRPAATATAAGMGIYASTQSQDAEAAYIPLRAFGEASTEFGKSLYKAAKKDIDGGMPDDELYRKHGVYLSEDGDYKVDIGEIKARNIEYYGAMQNFITAADKIMKANAKFTTRQSLGKMGDFLPSDSPILQAFPELADSKVVILSPKNKGEIYTYGAYTPSTKEIEVYLPSAKSPAMPSDPDAVMKRMLTGFGTLVHEFQHHAQNVLGSKNTGFNTMRSGRTMLKLDARERMLSDKIQQGAGTAEELAAAQKELDRLRSITSDYTPMSFGIYVRELGESEARGAGAKAHLTESERRAVGVYYPKDDRTPSIDPESIMANDQFTSDDVLIRTYDSEKGWEDLDFADSSNAKKGRGALDLPSSAFAGLVGSKLGIDMFRKWKANDGLSEEDAALMDDYVFERTGIKPSEIEMSGEDIMNEVPFLAEALMMSDALSAVAESYQMEEDEEQPEAIDEFTGVESTSALAQGGLLSKTEPKTGGEDMKPKMSCGGMMKGKDKGAKGLAIMIEQDVPPGALPEEVADDMPAMLSEGEYVVPADVVRWHGVKTLEALRAEAKMGLGMMDADDRIKGHEEEEYEEEEEETYETEEGNEVIKAAEGGLVAPQAKPTFYRYVPKLNPNTNRYDFVPVAVETNEVVTPENYDVSRATRYSVPNMMDEIHQRSSKGACEDGYVWDEETQSCVPAEEGDVEVGQGSVVDPTATSGTAQDMPAGRTETQYADQMSTKLADKLGPLSESQLADYEGENLEDKALARMREKSSSAGYFDSPAKILTGGIMGAIGAGIGMFSDAVGAKRAALTRGNVLSGQASDAVSGLGVGETAEVDITAYNHAWDADTASFKPVTASTTITSLGVNSSGDAYVADWNQNGASGKSYDLTNDWDSMSDADWEDVFDQIDADFGSLNTNTGANQVTTSINDSSNPAYSGSDSSTSTTPSYTSSLGSGVSTVSTGGIGGDYYSGGTVPSYVAEGYTREVAASKPATTTTSNTSSGSGLSTSNGGLTKNDDGTYTVSKSNTASSSSSDSSSSSGGGGCVIATHGVMTGGFTVREKAAAELYCIKNFHGTWWGEAFRRGYRYTGNKHIANGTAPEVYQEFKDFVKTGRGLKKDLKSRLNWAKRVVQFIVLGLTIARKD